MLEAGCWKRLIQLLVAEINIVEVILTPCRPAAEVMEGVVADSMPGPRHLAEYVGVLLHIIADTKESRSRVEFMQFFKYKLGRTRHRTIIEGEIQVFRTGFNPPRELRVKPGKEKRNAE